MGTFTSDLGRLVSSNVLTPADVAAGSLLYDPVGNTLTLRAQNSTTGTVVSVAIPTGAPVAPSSLSTSGFTSASPIALQRFVTISGVGQVKQASSPGVACAGVSTAAVPGGVPVPLTIGGVATVESGALINAGDRVTTDATGRAVPATATSVGVAPGLQGSAVLGQAIQGALGAGTPIDILWSGGVGLFPGTAI